MSVRKIAPREKKARQFDFFAVADESPAMIWVAGADKLCYWFNKGWLAFTGRSIEQEQGNGWTQGVHPDDLQRCLDQYVQHFDAREHFLLEYRLRRHDGEYRWILDSGSPRLDANGRFAGYNGICFDIHARKQFEEMARRQTEFINAVLECEPECVKVISPTGSLVMMNRAGLEMLEVPTADQAQSLGLEHFIVSEHVTAFRGLHKKVMNGEHGTLEFEIVSAKGTRRWLETHAAPLRDEHGDVVSLIGITRDVTERRALRGDLEHQAHFDYLTGLHNRRHFYALGDLELTRASRYGGALSLLMFDVDHFKEVNDTCGHAAGDLVLNTLAEVCRATLREIDIAGRLGGEEFAVWLPETDAGPAYDVAQRLRQAIANARTTLENGRSVSITASFGLTSVAGRPLSLDALMQEADVALYKAKKSGRNCVVAHETHLPDPHVNVSAPE